MRAFYQVVVRPTEYAATAPALVSEVEINHVDGLVTGLYSVMVQDIDIFISRELLNLLCNAAEFIQPVIVRDGVSLYEITWTQEVKNRFLQYNTRLPYDDLERAARLRNVRIWDSIHALAQAGEEVPG